MDIMFSGSGPEPNPGRKIDEDSLAEVKRLLTEEKEVEAIKVYREATGCGLREAVANVDTIKETLGTP